MGKSTFGARSYTGGRDGTLPPGTGVRLQEEKMDCKSGQPAQQKRPGEAAIDLDSQFSQKSHEKEKGKSKRKPKRQARQLLTCKELLVTFRPEST